MYHELGHSPVQHGTSCQGLQDDQQCTKSPVDGPIRTPRALQEDVEDTQGTQAPLENREATPRTYGDVAGPGTPIVPLSMLVSMETPAICPAEPGESPLVECTGYGSKKEEPESLGLPHMLPSLPLTSHLPPPVYSIGPEPENCPQRLSLQSDPVFPPFLGAE